MERINNEITQLWTHTVLLNYNFISTCVATRGISHVKCQSFPWKILFPCDEMWLFHETRHGISTLRDQPNGIWDNYYILAMPRECSYSQLKPVSECPVYIPFRHAYAFLLKFFQLLILLGKFLNICPPYYNILE